LNFRTSQLLSPLQSLLILLSKDTNCSDRDVKRSLHHRHCSSTFLFLLTIILPVPESHCFNTNNTVTRLLPFQLKEIINDRALYKEHREHHHLFNPIPALAKQRSQHPLNSVGYWLLFLQIQISFLKLKERGNSAKKNVDIVRITLII